MAVRLQCLHPSSAGVVVGWVAENQENSQKNHRKLAESTRDNKDVEISKRISFAPFFVDIYVSTAINRSG
uniref:Uncharacterized protein n=1 Tax=Cucumis melo TaxID=3656 RepID=A0A9I9EIY0_CUCME